LWGRAEAVAATDWRRKPCLPFTGEKNTVLKKFAVISGEIQATKCGAGQQPQ